MAASCLDLPKTRKLSGLEVVFSRGVRLSKAGSARQRAPAARGLRLRPGRDRGGSLLELSAGVENSCRVVRLVEPPPNTLFQPWSKLSKSA